MEANVGIKGGESMRPRSGLTLIELMIVMAILSILSAILVP